MMKRIGRISIGLCFVLIMVLVSPMFTSTVQAKDLDYIHEYTITADVQKDGKVKMKYHIKWEVLDSTSEGPLEWVKIGIANKHVDGISPLQRTHLSINALRNHHPRKTDSDILLINS